MENRIVTAVFKCSKNTKVSDVWQWDYGQILRIQGLDLPTAVEVDFAVAGASESISRIGTTKDGVTDVVIPDSLIETGNNLVAYIYLRDAESGNTEYQIDMIVTKRAKPEAYDTPEDKELFGQAIEAVNAAADRAEKAGKTAQEAATKTEQDAEQTEQDRVEVAKMVETVTDISEQVKKVEDLSNKAQAAATKTEADAQQTAEDRVEVGKMLETVKDVSEQVKTVEESVRKAKESEQAAAEHRTAVEEMKNSVEQTASTFPQTVQEGVQAVENAGTAEVQEITQAGAAQKTAVEGAGTQAVESVENVKASATEAVETAKTEAVQSVQTEGTKQTGNVSAEGAKRIKEVQDKGAEVLQSIPEDFATQMETKLNKQQGIENKGKVLVIGEDGNVVPEEVTSGGGASEKFTGMEKLASGTISTGTAGNTVVDTGFPFAEFKKWKRIIFLLRSAKPNGNLSIGFGDGNNSGITADTGNVTIIYEKLDAYFYKLKISGTNTSVYAIPKIGKIDDYTKTIWSNNVPIGIIDSLYTESYMDIRSRKNTETFSEAMTYHIKTWTETVSDIAWEMWGITK